MPKKIILRWFYVNTRMGTNARLFCEALATCNLPVDLFLRTISTNHHYLIQLHQLRGNDTPPIDKILWDLE